MPEPRRIPVGITTSPRPVRYLLDSVRSTIAASAAVRPEFIIAPNFVDPDENWDEVRKLIGPAGRVLDPLVNRQLREMVETEDSMRDFRNGNDIYASEWNHRGIQHNTDRLYRELLATGARAFVVMQDDVELCPRAIDRMYQLAQHVVMRSRTPPVGAISFYTPHKDVGKLRHALWRYAGDMFYGELCLLWNRQAAEDFLRISNPGQAHDLEIGRFFSSSRWRLYGHSPCLVQHTGVESARGAAVAGMQRTTMNYDPRHDAVAQGKEFR